jgi:hypothetical protein
VTQEPSPPSMRPYGRQILICEHGDCAPPEAAERLAARFRALARGHGLTTLRNPQRVKCTLSGCLGLRWRPHLGRLPRRDVVSPCG